ncbi:unnamed protein product [Durusdinium trenchii]|uniref:Secreted protein n=2 Tax=Durusdinium trenchii TaxID=1381693 RepID=A0ABP0ISR6_9DINO
MSYVDSYHMSWLIPSLSVLGLPQASDASAHLAKPKFTPRMAYATGWLQDEWSEMRSATRLPCREVGNSSLTTDRRPTSQCNTWQHRCGTLFTEKELGEF